MNPKTRQFIEQHINKIIREFDFENQKEKNPEDCVCFKEGKCHDVEELNCFLCYCPEYDNGIEEGGCKINSSKGKWFIKDGIKIWDCSDCDYPHRNEFVEKYLRRFFNFD
ncbi:MAG: cysteine-rich small domain-containing protein [archaeon]